MRKIKFRAWHEDEKEWMNWIDGLMFAIHHPEGNVKIMQFTGLFDKNGKEIYEGDIVKTDNYNGVHYFVVEFMEKYCGSLSAFVFDCVDGEYSSVHCEATHSSEVIGNIYENPELLEDLK